MLTQGSPAPGFCLPDTDGNQVCLKDFRGTWVVVYFYPKDNTSGCTTEAVTFSKSLDEFAKLNAVILGISPDSCESHRKFVDKQGLSITLLSDTEKTVLEQYGVWSLKKMYGKEYFGVVRTTYLVDPEGNIAHVWEKVKVPGHVDNVLSVLKEKVS